MPQSSLVQIVKPNHMAQQRTQGGAVELAVQNSDRYHPLRIKTSTSKISRCPPGVLNRSKVIDSAGVKARRDGIVSNRSTLENCIRRANEVFEDIYSLPCCAARYSAVTSAAERFSKRPITRRWQSTVAPGIVLREHNDGNVLGRNIMRSRPIDYLPPSIDFPPVLLGRT